MSPDRDPTNVYGYIRVSTRSQSYEIQEEKIKEYCNLLDYNLVDVFKDKVSGKNTQRAGFQRMMTLLEDNPHNIGAVVIFKIDRLGRSLRDLLNTAEFLKEHNVGLVSVMDHINSMTKEGRMVFYMFGVIAEFERENILERTSEGRLAAKDRGVKFGRIKKKVNIDEVRLRISDGVPVTRIARDLKVSTRTIYNRLGEERAERVKRHREDGPESTQC
jgi:DNA invertase Pin-like site-specific DNA recombinase